ncbi:MAG: hypothetical protein IT352_15470 [Gemmatimonadales bacterium]|nr:hypothetical protein [Gemmatimonadales bacterium]
MPAGSPATPPPARDLHDLLERAALEGRQPRPPDDGTGHDPEPPALRCQRCGLPIAIVVVTGITDDWDRFAWTHVLGGDDGHE